MREDRTGWEGLGEGGRRWDRLGGVRRGWEGLGGSGRGWDRLGGVKRGWG